MPTLVFEDVAKSPFIYLRFRTVYRPTSRHCWHYFTSEATQETYLFSFSLPVVPRAMIHKLRTTNTKNPKNHTINKIKQILTNNNKNNVILNVVPWKQSQCGLSQVVMWCVGNPSSLTTPHQ